MSRYENQSDSELMRLVAEGDRDAWGEVWQRYYREVKSIVHRKYEHGWEVGLRDAFENKLASLPSIAMSFNSQRGRLKTWLISVCSNAIKDHLNSADRRHRSTADRLGSHLHLKAAGRSGAENEAVLDVALQMVSGRYRELIEAAIEMNTFDVESLAARLTKKKSTVKTDISKAAKEMSGALQEARSMLAYQTADSRLQDAMISRGYADDRVRVEAERLLEKCEEEGTSPNRALHGLWQFNLTRGRYDVSGHYAARLMERTVGQYDEVIARRDLTELYTYTRDFDGACHELDAVSRMTPHAGFAESTGLDPWVSSFGHMAELHAIRGEVRVATETINRALRIADNTEHRASIAFARLFCAEIFAILGDFHRAYRHANIVLEDNPPLPFQLSTAIIVEWCDVMLGRKDNLQGVIRAHRALVDKGAAKSSGLFMSLIAQAALTLRDFDNCAKYLLLARRHIKTSGERCYGRFLKSVQRSLRAAS